MCAIFGYSGFQDENLITKMSQDQIFRGPDYFNYFTDKKVTIGNNRLSVIDVQNGSQPIFSEDKKFVIVYNGMIYNFNQIRDYLIKKNIKFQTFSDTEVILKSYMYWGDKCFNFFDGMWAVCIYDIEKNIIVLCRDYMGQKPLYYFHKNEKFCFSSKSDSIFLCEGLKKEINRDAIGQYLLYSHIPAPYSLYKNINQVRAGEIITYNFLNKELKKKKIYWDLSEGPDFNIFF